MHTHNFFFVTISSIIRLWKGGAECAYILAGHTRPVTSAHIINGKGLAVMTYSCARNIADFYMILMKFTILASC